MRIHQVDGKGRPRDVELTTDAEVTARDEFEEELSGGADIPTAARTVLEQGLANGSRFSAVFVEYLSENTLMITHGRSPRIVATPFGRSLS